jgi:hypothetical protein
MDFSTFSQYGIAAIFIAASWKLYNDMRADSSKREERLLAHLDKVSDTLDNINKRLCVVEECIKTDKE